MRVIAFITHSADNRHQHVEMLHAEEIHERRFGQWSMALVHLSFGDRMVRLQHPDFDPYSATGAQVMQLVMGCAGGRSAHSDACELNPLQVHI